MLRAQPRPTPFPYTTLFRSGRLRNEAALCQAEVSRPESRAGACRSDNRGGPSDRIREDATGYAAHDEERARALRITRLQRNSIIPPQPRRGNRFPRTDFLTPSHRQTLSRNDLRMNAGQVRTILFDVGQLSVLIETGDGKMIDLISVPPFLKGGVVQFAQ